MSENTRKHEFEIEIDAPPEVVWDAISKGEGLTRWFAPEARVEPGAGGSIWMSWGPGMEGSEPISIWDPPNQLQVANGPKTVDYHIEARGGGGSVLRLVHSGFGADASFDDEYDSTFGGWSLFLAILKYGLQRHGGTEHENVTVFRYLKRERAQVWNTLTGPDGFKIAAAELREGDAYTAVTPWGETIHGTVIRKPKPEGYLTLSVAEWDDAALSLFAEGGASTALTIMCILFGDARQQAVELRGRFSETLSRLFEEPVTATTT